MGLNKREREHLGIIEQELRAHGITEYRLEQTVKRHTKVLFMWNGQPRIAVFSDSADYLARKRLRTIVRGLCSDNPRYAGGRNGQAVG